MQIKGKMRTYLIGLLLIFLIQGYSQKLTKTYYNSSWMLTTRSLAQYCRVGFIDTVNYQYYGVVSDYYLNTGKLQMTGNYLANSKNGPFNFFNPDGKLITEGYYKDNVRFGIWTNYYENGKFKDKILFNNTFIKALLYYDTNGVQKMINGTGEWQTEYYNDYSHELITLKGYYQDSLMEGTWNFYARDMFLATPGISQLQRSEIYHKGKFVKGKQFYEGQVLDINSPRQNLVQESIKFRNIEIWRYLPYASIDEYPYLKFLQHIDSTIFPVDSFAEFPGGLDSLAKTLLRRIKLPRSYFQYYSKTAHFIYITIDEYGKLTIKKDNAHDDVFHKQAVLALQNLPDWKPAQRNFRHVINYFEIYLSQDDGKVKVKIRSNNELTGTYKSGIVYHY